MLISVPKETVYTEVEVAMPLFFVHCLDRSAVYGMVTEEAVTTVHEYAHAPPLATTAGTLTYTNAKYEIKRKVQHPNQSACYLKPGYKSDPAEFGAAMIRAKNFVNSL